MFLALMKGRCPKTGVLLVAPVPEHLWGGDGRRAGADVSAPIGNAPTAPECQEERRGGSRLDALRARVRAKEAARVAAVPIADRQEGEKR